MSLDVQEAVLDATTEKFLAARRMVRAHRHAEAVALYDEILSETPDKPHIWINRGVALQGLYRLDEAIESFERALACEKNHVDGHINRAVVRQWVMRYEESLADYSRALALEPDNEAALLGRSVVYATLGRDTEALADIETVLAVNTGCGGAHYNKALILLSQGDYAEGFREHEWRFGTNSVLGFHRFPQPVWTGQNTRKRILVWGEQGLGDSIQFLRYVPLLAERGLDVVIEVPKALARLCRQSFHVPVIARDEPLPAFDLHCPIMSLGAAFGTTLDTVPLCLPYLLTDAYEVRHWCKQMQGRPGLKVGFAWSSGVRKEQPIAVAMQRRKSIPTAQIEALFRVKGVVPILLQKDTPEDGWPQTPCAHPVRDCEDLAATAALIEALDLVITVDSAVAHVAGALGKPVWVLNRLDICWRWLSGGKISPWYPSARIYRQNEPGRWDDVLAQVQGDLERMP